MEQSISIETGHPGTIARLKLNRPTSVIMCISNYIFIMKNNPKCESSICKLHIKAYCLHIEKERKSIVKLPARSSLLAPNPGLKC